jgi:hypothetical protein
MPETSASSPAKTLSPRAVRNVPRIRYPDSSTTVSVEPYSFCQVPDHIVDLLSP